MFYNTFIASLAFWLDWSFQCGWDNLSWQVEVFTKVINTFISQVPIIVTPAELFLYVSLWFQTLQCFNHIKIGHLWQGWMSSFWMKIFLCHHHAFLEKIFEYSITILDWHQHGWNWLLYEWWREKNRKWHNCYYKKNCN